tara:strand:+ start:1653 stop:2051 length:399 start_codon:yes stop_codon:yes gene_type:complete
MTKGDNNMSTEQVQHMSNTNTKEAFMPYSVDDSVVDSNRGKIFTKDVLELLTSNPNRWYVVSESFIPKEDRDVILSKRSVYYTAGKNIQRKFGNVDYKVKGGVENVQNQMSNGFDYTKEVHAVRLYARWSVE